MCGSWWVALLTAGSEELLASGVRAKHCGVVACLRSLTNSSRTESVKYASSVAVKVSGAC